MTNHQHTADCADHGRCGHGRRGFLVAAGALGVGALAGGFRAAAATQARRIDVHHHIFPPQFLKEAPPRADQFRRMPAMRDWSLQRSIDDMDKNGIEISVLSFPQPSFWSPERDDQRRLARMCNDFFAGLVRDRPARFGLFAGLPPLTDVDGALAEIDYAFGTLKADGVRAMTSYQDKWLGDPSFAPVMDELNRRNAVMFIHPDVAACCVNLMPSVPVGYVEYPLDTARAATNLWVNGAFDRWPNIRMILSHGGGALPMVADRVAQSGRPGTGSGAAPLHDAMEQFRRLYYDTANAANPPALAAIKAFADPAHILFGTDDPFISMPRQIEKLREGPFSPAQLRAIERDNALRLLPGIAARVA
jgi:predicted TIM-barrel fold metal-dependent hydrolase